MNSANSSSLAQSNLPHAYHHPNYVSNSRGDIDLLTMSQTDLLAQQLNFYSVAQNPTVLRNIGLLQQTASPESSFPSYQSRSFPQDQLAKLMRMTQHTSNDLYTSRLGVPQMPGLILGGTEDFNAQIAKIGIERSLASNPNTQPNSIMQFLETSELQAQSQKDLNELLLMKLNKNNFANKNNIGYALPPYIQNTTSFTGLLPNQNFYLNQNQEEKALQDFYSQNVEFFEPDNINKRFTQRQKEIQANLAIQDSKNMFQTSRPSFKNKEDRKLSNEKLFHLSQIRSQNKERPQSHDNNSLAVQIQEPNQINKTKQPPIEIVIEDQEEVPKKSSEEVSQTGMLLENSVETVESSTLSSSELKTEPIPQKSFQCFNKFCLTDTSNAVLWAEEKLQNSEICKNCLDAFHKDKYCYFCKQIYHDDETAASNDDKDWIECDSCKTWNHIDCETLNNMKNLRLFIQKDKNYKYFCPNCKQNSQQHSSPKNAKSTRSHSSSPSQIIFEQGLSKPIIQPAYHPKPPLDKNTLNEEDSLEPTIKKIRLVETSKIQIIEPQPNSILSKEDNFRNDFAKKKLDSMFNKSSFQKKRAQGRSTNILETSIYIERLLNQYGGTRLQMSEEEIKNDLILFKKLSNMKDGIEDNFISSKEDFGTEKAEPLEKEAFSQKKFNTLHKTQLFYNLKSEKVLRNKVQKSVWINGRKVKGKKNRNEINEQNLSESESIFKGNNRTLRYRK